MVPFFSRVCGPPDRTHVTIDAAGTFGIHAGGCTFVVVNQSLGSQMYVYIHIYVSMHVERDRERQRGRERDREGERGGDECIFKYIDRPAWKKPPLKTTSTRG